MDSLTKRRVLMHVSLMEMHFIVKNVPITDEDFYYFNNYLDWVSNNPDLPTRSFEAKLSNLFQRVNLIHARLPDRNERSG